MRSLTLSLLERIYPLAWRVRHPRGRVVMIDGGANTGQLFTETLEQDMGVTRDARRRVSAFRIRHLRGAAFHLFEPDPLTFFELAKTVTQHNIPGARLYNLALWTATETRAFYRGRDPLWKDQGSTLYPEKQEPLDRDRPIRVACIDLASLLRAQCTHSDYVIVKLDIEGAEFDVVERLWETGALGLVNELHVEWHLDMFPRRRPQYERIMKALRGRRGLVVDTWPA